MRTPASSEPILAALRACCAALALGCGPVRMPASLGHPLFGGAAPSFQAKSTDARTVGVPGTGRTRVTVIDFWASWCATCSTTMPALNAIWHDHKGDGVMVIGVSVDETAGAAQAAARALGASFPIVEDLDRRLAGSYGVAQLPLTFVVDSAGRVRWVGHDPAGARRAVDVVLSEAIGARPGSVLE